MSATLTQISRQVSRARLEAAEYEWQRNLSGKCALWLKLYKQEWYISIVGLLQGINKEKEYAICSNRRAEDGDAFGKTNL